MTPTMHRRSFLAGAATALSASFITTDPVFGHPRPAPSERITIGLIGAGKRGGTLLRHVLNFSQVEVVAVAEVESQRREHRARSIESHYAGKKDRPNFKGVGRYNDFLTA